MRLAILGNAGSGKSTLALRLSAERGLPYHEIDRLLWHEGWAMVPESQYDAAHTRLIHQGAWVIDGLGLPGSIGARLDRATHVILCDFPLWQHYWLLAERQTAWAAGTLQVRPGGQADPPPTRVLFQFVAQIDRDIMPGVRDAVEAVGGDTVVCRIASFEELVKFDLPAA